MKIFGYELGRARPTSPTEKIIKHSHVDNRDPVTSYSLNEPEGVRRFLDSLGLSSNPITVSAVFAATRIYSGTVSQLNLELMEELPNGNVQKVRNVQFHRLFNRQPHDLWSASRFWDTIITDVLLKGNAYALIQRRGNELNSVIKERQTFNGRQDPPFTGVQGLRYIPPEMVTPVKYNNIDRLYYTIQDAGDVDQLDILHFAFANFDGLKGRSILETGAKQAVRMYQMMDEFSASVFESGNLQDTYFIMKNSNPDQHEKFQKNVIDKYFIGNKGRNKPRILEGDISVQKVNLNLRDQQLLESKRAAIEDIARAFMLPPEALGLATSSEGIVEMMAQHLRFGANPIMRDVENEITRKMFMTRTENNGLRSVRFDTSGLSRNLEIERAEIYRKALGDPGNAGWMTPNEIRQREGMTRSENPMADQLMVPDNMMTSGPDEPSPESETENN